MERQNFTTFMNNAPIIKLLIKKYGCEALMSADDLGDNLPFAVSNISDLSLAGLVT